MKAIITIVAFVFASISLTAQTTSTKTTAQTKKTTAVKKQKKPRLSHSGPGIENTGTTAITITNNDTANYQGPGKKGATRKTTTKKTIRRTSGNQ
jgi:hypothetical protein